MHLHRKGIDEAGMVELVDTQDLKSCGRLGRTGSIPVPGTAALQLSRTSPKGKSFSFLAQAQIFY